MKCLFLAAGYATRLYPLTENFPKPLLPVTNKPILDWLIDDIDKSGVVDEYIVVTNHKFAGHFSEWTKNKKQKITIVDDGTSSNETRLGAVKDIDFALKTCGINDDILILAGDNLLDFSLTTFISYLKEKNSSCIMRYYEADENRLSKSGVVTIDECDRVIKMSEKPSQPDTHWCTPPFYFYTKEDIKLIDEAISDGCGVDAPGSFVSWLCKKRTIFAMEMPGKRYDIGNLENYNRINEIWNKENRCL